MQGLFANEVHTCPAHPFSAFLLLIRWRKTLLVGEELTEERFSMLGTGLGEGLAYWDGTVGCGKPSLERTFAMNQI